MYFCQSNLMSFASMDIIVLCKSETGHVSVHLQFEDKVKARGINL